MASHRVDELQAAAAVIARAARELGIVDAPRREAPVARPLRRAA
jgi:hypothetical protein